MEYSSSQVDPYIISIVKELEQLKKRVHQLEKEKDDVNKIWKDAMLKQKAYDQAC